MQPVPFQARHMLRMSIQPRQRDALAFLTTQELQQLESPHTGTLLDDLGEPLVCCGVVPFWRGRAYVWAFLSDRVNARNFRAVHAWGKAFIAGLPYRRIEIAVAVDFVAGHRWMAALGFVVEAPRMRAFDPAGRDHTLYALVK